MTQAPPRLAFRSKEEFRDACRALSGRMHSLNRISMGESKFAWEVADLLTRLGRVFDEHYDDEEVARAFGNGYEPGQLGNDDERRDALWHLLYASHPKDGS